ncbi:hypothetical protein HDV00_009378 [Rhizophlyctis rosea]|nr:hypothetical protein HDV00_009378 [Rhizophlyctis rosea]
MVQLTEALLAKQSGPLSDVLYVDSVPRPVPKPNQVVVRVRSTAVNPVDWKLVVHASFFNVTTWPKPIGFDVSGIVEEVGEGVTEFAVGDEVWARAAEGGFAEYTVADAIQTFKKPNNLTFDQAATLPVGIATAVLALFADKGLGLKRKADGQEQEWVLINGGASSVGVYAIQLAARAGYKVITTASAKNEQYLQSLGATHTIDYHLPSSDQLSSIRTLTSNTLRHSIDIVGKESSELAGKALDGHTNATLILLAHFGALDTPAGVTVRSLGAKTPELQVIAKEITEEDVLPALASGELKANNVRVLEGGLEGLKEGLRLSQEGKVSAVKLVVNP